MLRNRFLLIVPMVVLSLFCPACGDDDEPSGTTDVSEDQGDVAPDVVDQGPITLTGTSALQAAIDATDEGAFLFALLPDGYEMEDDPTSDILAVVVVSTPTDYTGGDFSIPEGEGVLKEVEYDSSSNELEITESEYTGTYGDYSLLIAFFPDYETLGLDVLPTHLTEDVIEINVDTETGIADIGTVTVPPVEQAESTLSVTGTLNLAESIEATSTGAFAVLLMPEGWTFETAEETPGTPLETLAEAFFTAPADYTGGDVEMTPEDGLMMGVDSETGATTTEPWTDGEPGKYALLVAFLDSVSGIVSHDWLIEEVTVTSLPAVVEVGTVTLQPLPTTTFCTYTQPLVYIDESVDGEEPCGESDGTCISGHITFDEETITIAEVDVGEAYLFANPSGAPIIEFRRINPPSVMGYKIPNIPSDVTDACDGVLLSVGGRLDVGGNHQGLPAGPEDPLLPVIERLTFTLDAGEQIDDLDFTITAAD